MHIAGALAIKPNCDAMKRRRLASRQRSHSLLWVTTTRELAGQTDCTLERATDSRSKSISLLLLPTRLEEERCG